MITCMGLIVGIVDSDKKDIKTDVLNQCAEFLKKHRYLTGLENVRFEIDGFEFATMLDTRNFDDGKFGVLFRMYTGFCEVVMI